MKMAEHTETLEIPEEARERAFSGTFGDTLTRRQVDEVLELAGPLIVAAELERLAAEIDAPPKELADYSPQGKQYNAGKDYVRDRLHVRASVLRGEV